MTDMKIDGLLPSKRFFLFLCQQLHLRDHRKFQQSYLSETTKAFEGYLVESRTVLINIVMICYFLVSPVK